jgi:two-component system LytT family response regulator
VSERLRVLIVDDERLARDGARSLLASEPDVEVIGECGDGASALAALLRGDVDLLLLDVQMPGMDGFEVLRATPDALRPVVVFLTAFDQHALRAFDAQALDYVVKPFTDERFRTAIARARAQVRQRRLGQLGRPADAPIRNYLARIPVRSVGKVAYVPVSDIVWIGAADYYSELHTADGKKHLVRETMQSLDERLDPARFTRVHRSAIVNLEQVREVRSEGSDRQTIILRNGTRLPLGRHRREALEQALARKP